MPVGECERAEAGGWELPAGFALGHGGRQVTTRGDSSVDGASNDSRLGKQRKPYRLSAKSIWIGGPGMSFAL
jgi:hypothetical protein